MNISTANVCRRVAAATLCCAIFSGLSSVPAGAVGLEPASLTVKYGDLDVSRPEGSTVLYNRIRAAAQRVCAPLEGGGAGLAANKRLTGCIDKAISDAVKTVPQSVRLASRQSRLQLSGAASKR